MKRLLVVLALLVAGGIGLAFYLGWFHLTVDQDKFQGDKENVVEKVHNLGHHDKDTPPVQ
jgi:hypothetical protein